MSIQGLAEQTTQGLTDQTAPRDLSPLRTFLLASVVGIVLPVVQFCIYTPYAAWGGWFWLAVFLAPLVVAFAMVCAGANAFSLPLGFACGILPGAFIVGLLAAFFVKPEHGSIPSAFSLVLTTSFAGPVLYGTLSYAGASLARLAKWMRGRQWHRT